MEEEIIGTTGKIVDLFNENLTQEEWNALCVIHRLGARLNLGIRFDWSKSIDVRSEDYSQIVDESVFINKEQPKTNLSLSELKDLLSNVNQLIEGWNATEAEWTEWDKQVHSKVYEMQLKLDGKSEAIFNH